MALVASTRRSGPRNTVLARFSAAHLVVALAGLLGVLLTLSVLRAADHRVAVVVARRDLLPGSRIVPGDLTTANVHADGSVLAGLVRASDLSHLDGRLITSVVRRGDLVRADDITVATSRGARRTMSFAVDRANAVNGDLRAGDRVDAVAVDRQGTNAGFVLVDATVIAVDEGGGGPLRDNASKVTVTVSVNADDALRLASALSAGNVTIIRSTGASRLDRVPRYQLSQPAAGNA